MKLKKIKMKRMTMRKIMKMRMTRATKKKKKKMMKKKQRVVMKKKKNN